MHQTYLQCIRFGRGQNAVVQRNGCLRLSSDDIKAGHEEEPFRDSLQLKVHLGVHLSESFMSVTCNAPSQKEQEI